MGGFLPIPPSSAYCVQRSDSISSAAARNWRMATSPGLRESPDCARAKGALASKLAPITAPPARSPPFIKDRRSTDCLKDGRSASFVMCTLQLFLFDFRCRYCVLDAAPIYEIHDGCQLIVNSVLQKPRPITMCAVAN